MRRDHQYGLPCDAIQKICTVFAQYPEIKKVLLYGSRALGKERLGSDIDLCIEGDSLRLSELFSIENQLDDLLLPWKIDLSLKHSIDNQALLAHVNEYGVVFYEGAPLCPS